MRSSSGVPVTGSAYAAGASQEEGAEGGAEVAGDDVGVGEDLAHVGLGGVAPDLEAVSAGVGGHTGGGGGGGTEGGGSRGAEGGGRGGHGTTGEGGLDLSNAAVGLGGS